jgi:hypothetical protein
MEQVEGNENISELLSGSLDIDIDKISKEVESAYSGFGRLALQDQIANIKQARNDINLELKKIYKDSSL